MFVHCICKRRPKPFCRWCSIFLTRLVANICPSILSPYIYITIKHQRHTGKIKDTRNIALWIALAVKCIEIEWSHNSTRVWWHVSAPESSPKEPKTWGVVSLSCGTHFASLATTCVQHALTTDASDDTRKMTLASCYTMQASIFVLYKLPLLAYAEHVKDTAECDCIKGEGMCRHHALVRMPRWRTYKARVDRRD